MNLPIGLRKPHRLAELTPAVLALAGVLIATAFAILHLVQMSG